jgi:hypothetical protein
MNSHHDNYVTVHVHKRIMLYLELDITILSKQYLRKAILNTTGNIQCAKVNLIWCMSSLKCSKLIK